MANAVRPQPDEIYEDQSQKFPFLEEVLLEFNVIAADHAAAWTRIIRSTNVQEATLLEMAEGALASDDTDVTGVLESRSQRKYATAIQERWQQREQLWFALSMTGNPETELAQLLVERVVAPEEHSALCTRVRALEEEAREQALLAYSARQAEYQMEAILFDLETIQTQTYQDRMAARRLKEGILDQLRPVRRRGKPSRERKFTTGFETEETTLEVEARKLRGMDSDQRDQYFLRLRDSGLSEIDVEEIQAEMTRLEAIDAKKEQITQALVAASAFRARVYQGWQEGRVARIEDLQMIRRMVGAITTMRQELANLRSPRRNNPQQDHLQRPPQAPRTVATSMAAAQEPAGTGLIDRAALIAAIRQITNQELGRIQGQTQLAPSPVPALRRLCARIQILPIGSIEQMLSSGAKGLDLAPHMVQEIKERSEAIKTRSNPPTIAING